MGTIKTAYDKSSGYKSRIGALMFAVYTLVETIDPSLIDGKAESIVQQLINIFLIVGGSDWAIKSSGKIINQIKGVFNKK